MKETDETFVSLGLNTEVSAKIRKFTRGFSDGLFSSAYVYTLEDLLRCLREGSEFLNSPCTSVEATPSARNVWVHADRDPFHARVSASEYICLGSGWITGRVDAWGRPEGERMMAFQKGAG